MFRISQNEVIFTRLLSKYRQLPADESDMEDNAQQKTRGRRSSFLVALMVLFGITVGTAFVLMLLDVPLSPTHFTPNLRTITVVFEENPIFVAESSPRSDAAWDDLMPSGRGFVLVEHPDRYHLGPGIPSAAGPDKYGISMFHQLHCLGMLREAYYAAVQGREANIAAEESLSESQMEHSRISHMGHCFDYLRQAIMCAGDMTLESAERTASGRIKDSVDGWGIAHECKSWDDAVEWTLRHRSPSNRTGIA